MIVYTLASVCRAIEAGYDVSPIAIDRRPDGSRTYRDGVLLLTESDADVWAGIVPEGDGGPIPADALRTDLPVPGPVVAAERLSPTPSPSYQGPHSGSFPRSDPLNSPISDQVTERSQ